MKKCDTCFEGHYAIFVFNGSRQVCRDCFMKEKTEIKKLVRKLPNVPEKDAPLGWNRVGFDYYADTGVGKTQANILYKHHRTGMVN